MTSKRNTKQTTSRVVEWCDQDSPDVEYISFVKFQIISGKKHQIRAHTSQVLKCPILLDYKYGFEQEGSFNNQQFKNLMFGKKYTSRLEEAMLKEVKKHTGKTNISQHLLYRIYAASTQTNNTLCLHAYKVGLTLPGAEEQTEIQARFSLQIRTILSLLKVDEQQVYADMNNKQDNTDV